MRNLLLTISYLGTRYHGFQVQDNAITVAQVLQDAMESGGLMQRAKALVPILIPLFVSSFRRADELAMAMECRCYRGGEGRTRMKEMRLQGRDAGAVIVLVLYLAAVIVLRKVLV